MKLYKQLLLILFLLQASFFLSGEEFYRSNSIAMVFENIPPFRLDEFDWVIKISVENDVETRILYYLDMEKERVEYFREGKSLKVIKYIDNFVVSEEEFLEGLLVEELVYANGKPEGKYIYTWESGQLKKVSYFSAGVHIYDNLYIKQGNGKIKQIRRIFTETDMLASEYIYSDNRLFMEWFGTDKTAYLYRYEKDSVYLIENWKDGKIVGTISYTRDGQDKLVVEKDLLSGNETRRSYDPEERLLSEITYNADGITRKEYYYEEAVLVEKKVSTSGIREKYLYFYTDTDILEKEQQFVNGILRKVTSYDISGKKTEEDLYKNSNLLLKVFYINGEKSGEERF